ncbi:MAG: endonuclease III, partial [Hyphomicrobium sp.]|nr:endonuclease III [Hyphomicrobium sp.]
MKRTSRARRAAGAKPAAAVAARAAHSKPKGSTAAKAKSTRLLKTSPLPPVAEIFARFARIEPEPKGELEHVNAFTLLVAVVLSAQATDAGVNKATRALFKIADTPQKMLELG